MDNFQNSLAGGGINEEEKLLQAKKAEMQKKYSIISLTLVGIIVLSIVIYVFIEQKCFVLGHDWQTATCTTGKICTVCAAVEGKANGHNWQEATCTNAKTCKVCDAVDGIPLGHFWKEATCTDPQICSLCFAVDGAALGHSWSTTSELAYCSICNQPNGRLVNLSNDLLISSWSDQKLELTLENGRKSDPTILLTNSTVEKCYSLTLCLRIDELNAGNVFGEWGFYIRDLKGKWHLADTFNLASDYVEAHFEFDEPISFDAWACPCHALGDYWNFSFSVWLKDATVFKYDG